MADITTLQQSLINAKKVMNRVDGKTNPQLPPQTINENTTMAMPSLPDVDINSARQDLRPKSHMTTDKIKNSRLPSAIKEAMINNPIPDVPFNNSTGLSGDFLNGVKEQMDKQGIPIDSQKMPIPITSSMPSIPSPNIGVTTKKLSSKNLKSIIKESVKELIEETITEKMEGINYFSSDKKDNFKFIVGDKIFYGKITASKDLK